MEDKQFEEILRESWSPEPPDGMRERVLRRSRRELPAQRRGLLAGMLRWKPLLVAAAAMIILLMGISEHKREQRLAALLDAPPAGATATSVYNGLRDRQLQLAELLALAPSECLESDMRGDEQL